MAESLDQRRYYQPKARVDFHDGPRDVPVLWLDDDRFCVCASCVPDGRKVNATFTFGRTFELTIPACAEVAQDGQQTFQFAEMPRTLRRMFDTIARFDYRDLPI